MGVTYSCSFDGCNKAFSKAFELKKHRATHEDPESVFYCSECDFITLRKKNLAIHFALHTGEKIHGCPDMISFSDSSGSPRSERCEYRTNDPAALSRHRKKAHQYIPPPNRIRNVKAAPAAPRKPRQQKDEKISRCGRRSQRPVSVSRRKLSHVPCKATIFSSSPNYMPVSADFPESSTSLLHRGDVDRDSMNVDCHEEFCYYSSGATLIGSDEVGLDTLCDPSLRPQWMATYEEGYSTFDVTGMEHLPELLYPVPPSASTCLDAQTGREGCLCPDWMSEARVEGWD